MQIREAGNRTQLLRAQYVKAERDENGNLVKGTGRTKVIMIGSFDRYATTVNQIESSLLEKLDTDETKQLTDYIQEKEQRMSEFKISQAPARIIENMQIAANNYDPAVVTDEQIEAIKDGLSKLLKARRVYKKLNAK